MISKVVVVLIVQVAIQTEQQEGYLLPVEATVMATGGFGPRLPLAPNMLPLRISLGTALTVNPITQ